MSNESTSNFTILYTVTKDENREQPPKIKISDKMTNIKYQIRFMKCSKLNLS